MDESLALGVIAEQLGVPVLDEGALEQILATGEVPQA